MVEQVAGRKPRRLYVLLLILVFLSAVAGFSVLNRRLTQVEKLAAVKKPDLWPVGVQTVQPQPFIERIVADNMLEPMERAALTAEVSARVQAIQADLGDRVRQGQALIVLDPTAYQLALDNAQAGLAAARVQVRQARDDFERVRRLAEKDLATREEFDRARTAMNTAEANEQMAGAALDTARRARNETVIRAPFNGRVSSRSISLGELASPGAPLMEIVKDDLMRVDLALSEREIGLVRPGMEAIVRLPAQPDRQWTGRVTRIGVAADTASGSYPVRVEVNNPEGALLAGMRAAVEVELRRVPDAVVVIRDQVIAREGRDAAFVVVEKEGKTLVEARPLTLGARDGQHLHVLEGLQAGELLVVVGQHSLGDGSEVAIVEKDGVSTAPEATPSAAPAPTGEKE